MIVFQRSNVKGLTVRDGGRAVVDQFVQAMAMPISVPRLERYRPKTGAAPNLHMLTNYFWNMDLAEALFPSLHAVEVALRNTINTTLVGRCNTPL